MTSVSSSLSSTWRRLCNWVLVLPVQLAHLLPTCWLIHLPFHSLLITLVQTTSLQKNDEKILLALEQRDRVCRIRLAVSPSSLQKVVMAIDEEYPILEYLLIKNVDERTALTHPKTLQAPHLSRLPLFGSTLPIRSRLPQMLCFVGSPSCPSWLSDIIVASVASALGCLFRICRGSSWP